MFTFSEMLALVQSESSFGAFVFHRRPAGLQATSDLTEIYSVRKFANARVRNFYAYEIFCDYSKFTIYSDSDHFHLLFFFPRMTLNRFCPTPLITTCQRSSSPRLEKSSKSSQQRVAWKTCLVDWYSHFQRERTWYV